MKHTGSPNFFAGQISNPNLLTKYHRLRAIIKPFGHALIGFSGGVDSTLLAGVARDVLGEESVTAYLATGPSLPKQEYNDALAVSAWMEVRLVEYPATEFENPLYLANAPDRCFHCKADLFSHLKKFALEFPKATLLYGGNADDTRDFRPGRWAAEQFGVRAPLAEAELSKAEVRALSQIFLLPTAEKPAQPCLSSRIPYGQAVDKTKLAMVEQGEIYLMEMGFREFRLRHYGDLARVEVPVDQFRIWDEGNNKDTLFKKLLDLGFQRIEIDPLGFRSGSLNEVLTRETESANPLSG